MAVRRKAGREIPGNLKIMAGRWNGVVPHMKFSPEIRRAICTANAAESLSFTLRRNLKTRLSFPGDEAATKLIFMILCRIKKR